MSSCPNGASDALLVVRRVASARALGFYVLLSASYADHLVNRSVAEVHHI